MFFIGRTQVPHAKDNSTIMVNYILLLHRVTIEVIEFLK
jgi:hypothetical protein